MRSPRRTVGSPSTICCTRFSLPKGSEIILPALTFWVIPELARAAGLMPVFADVDPHTFTLDPAAFERAITPRTSAVVPTHLYGLAVRHGRDRRHCADDTVSR